METACTCSDFGRDGPQSSNVTTNPKEKQWMNANLCNQCASIDLNKLLHSESSYNCENWPKFRGRPDSACPLCQFFVAVVSTTGSAISFDEEFEYRLGLTSPAVMFSSMLADTLDIAALNAVRFIGVKTSDSRLPHQPDLCIAPLCQHQWKRVAVSEYSPATVRPNQFQCTEELDHSLQNASPRHLHNIKVVSRESCFARECGYKGH